MATWKCHTCAVKHVKKPFYACGWVTFHTWMSDVTHLSESCHIREWVTWHMRMRQWDPSWRITDFKRSFKTSPSCTCIIHTYMHMCIYTYIYIHIYIYICVYIYTCIWCFTVRLSAKERHASGTQALTRRKCVAALQCVAARVAVISSKERQASASHSLTRRLSQNLTHAHLHAHTHTQTHTHTHTQTQTHTHTQATRSLGHARAASPW